MILRLLLSVFVVQVIFIGIIYVTMISNYSKLAESADIPLLRTTSLRSLNIVNNNSSPIKNRTESLNVPEHVVQKSGKVSTFLLIMVSVRPELFRVRECIRDTWYRGFNDSEDVIMRFAVGTKGKKQDVVTRLQNESEVHGDLVLMGHIEDHWITPTRKTLSMIAWAHENVDFKYFMKSEESTFVYVKNMISELRKRPTTDRLLYGKMQFKRKPIRKNSEWADPDWDLATTYLPFPLGGGYILSSDLVELLARKKDYLALHPNEDTAVASWVAAYHYERRDDKLWCVTPFNKDKKLEGKCEAFIIARFCYGLQGDELRKWFNILAKPL